MIAAPEAGKPAADCPATDVPGAAKAIRCRAEAQDNLHDRIASGTPHATGLTVPKPVGVAAAVPSWSFPMREQAWKIGPAVAICNPVVAEPSEITSLGTLRAFEMTRKAGLPPGVLDLVTDADSGGALAPHMDSDAITFAGSSAVGRRIKECAAQPNLKEVRREAGGKSAAVMCSDSGRIDRIAVPDGCSALADAAGDTLAAGPADICPIPGSGVPGRWKQDGHLGKIHLTHHPPGAGPSAFAGDADGFAVMPGRPGAAGHSAETLCRNAGGTMAVASRISGKTALPATLTGAHDLCGALTGDIVLTEAAGPADIVSAGDHVSMSAIAWDGFARSCPASLADPGLRLS